MKKYFPILVAKKGELVALERLSQNVKDEIVPVLEIINESIEKPSNEESKKKKKKKVPYSLIEKTLRIHWNFFDNQIFFDFSLFKELDKQIKVIRGLITSLINSGVNIVPVVNRESTKDYLLLVDYILALNNSQICIRVGWGSTGAFDNAQDVVKKFCDRFNVSPETVSILLDLGAINGIDKEGCKSKTIDAIMSLPKAVEDWKNVIVAAGSFPENLSDVIDDKSGHILTRYEWIFWNELKEENGYKNIKYGDYGTKSARFMDAKHAGTISLKYTAPNYFVIFKGKLSGDHKHGHRQIITHCQNLISSRYCSEQEFSWGDLKYYDLSLKNPDSEEETGVGNTTNWIQYSQNHHITLQHHLL
ncbi:MAG: hypothetical protein IT237_10155 [Bacteroidia bacterium]|nr:hypothetical protein [Bacteroidia bacterium]